MEKTSTMLALHHRTWRELRLVSLAHGIRFDTRQSRQQGYEQVRQRLIADGYLRKAFRHLTPDEREPLLALQANGGVLPRHELTAIYGPIRPYKPWQAVRLTTYQEREAARFPWKRPVSVVEKLWHLGLIELQQGSAGQPDQAVLPDEVVALLPPPPRPVVQDIPAIEGADEQHRCFLTRDLAALLAGLLAGEGHWRRHGSRDRRWLTRWLTPRSLQHLNRRLLVPDQLDGIRSERQCGRLRFLHYGLDAAGLLQGGLPTVQAWHWLAQSEPERQRWFWSAIQADLRHRDPRWRQYGLPPVTLRAWDRLTAVLDSLQPGVVYARDSIYRMVRFALDRTTFETLLSTVFTWSDWIRIEETALRVHERFPGGRSGSQAARLSRHHQMLYLDLPLCPPLRPLVDVAAWAEVETPTTLKVSLEALRRAVEQGHDAPQVIQMLAALTGEPLSAEVVALIQSGVQAARGLTLRPLLVLTAADPTTLTAIRSDWRLRPLLGDPLSPHHLVVQTDQASALAAKLARRGCPITLPKTGSKPGDEAKMVDEATDYLYLTVSVYRQLSRITAPEVRLPGELHRSLQNTLPTERVEALDQTAVRLVEHLRRSLTLVDQPVARGGVEQEDAAGIVSAVEMARQQRGCLTIQYYSPYTGETTTRTIEPVLCYRRNGADYVEAWCRLDEAIRTFRMDRILRLMPATAPEDER